MTWAKTVPVFELAGRPRVFKRPPLQVALFQVGERVFAVDNRCPHEGYPLAEGKVDEACVLTCNWHNWKFRLEDGECLLGGDHVRAYPAKVEDGFVWVDFAEPPAEVIIRRTQDGLRKAFAERDFGRVCREVSRLRFHGLDPLLAVRRAVEWSHDRLEFGYTHAYAAAADWLTLARTFAADWEKGLICLAEAVDHMAFDSLKGRTYPYAPPGSTFTRQAFLDAVEGERTAGAEGMVRRGLADGLHWPDLEEAFVAAALAHYNDFGHSLIYVYKNAQLLGLAGGELEPYLLPALARHLCYATREDLIPEFRGYAEVLANLPAPADRDKGPLHAQALFPVSTRDALAWVARHIGDHRPQTLYNALLEALARNLLHFDTSFDLAFDRPVRQNVGWLDFTHGVTFANAARVMCTRYPQYWGAALLQMACFLGRNRPYLDLSIDELAWRVPDPDAFFAAAHERILDHGIRDPIFSAHLVKPTAAAQEELPYASASCRAALLASLNRFLHSPIKQQHVRRLARQAIALVQRDFADKGNPALTVDD
jgi:nitrite reductase/ring-hydroxylating ferredoxin subunit